MLQVALKGHEAIFLSYFQAVGYSFLKKKILFCC